jgi:hypothetical protein
MAEGGMAADFPSKHAHFAKIKTSTAGGTGNIAKGVHNRAPNLRNHARDQPVHVAGSCALDSGIYG